MIPGFLLQLLLADLSQPLLSKFFNFPGIAITHLMALSGMVLAVPLNWLFDRIPGLKDLDVDPETIQEKFGLIGDPIIIGFVIGVVIGLLAGYDFGGFSDIRGSNGSGIKNSSKNGWNVYGRFNSNC